MFIMLSYFKKLYVDTEDYKYNVLKSEQKVINGVVRLSVPKILLF